MRKRPYYSNEATTRLYGEGGGLTISIGGGLDLLGSLIPARVIRGSGTGHYSGALLQHCS